MNGGQDLGGMHGLGPVVAEPNEPVFHAEWERRAFALTLAMGATGAWNIDMSRFARENRPPQEYLSMSYYQLWLAGLERLIEDAGLASADEIAQGRMLAPAKPVHHALQAQDVAATLARGGPCDRRSDAQPRFRTGDRVVARNINPQGHTRLPRYARTRTGVIHRMHGVYVFPDSNGRGEGEQPQHCYSVRFTARELWGEDGYPRQSVFVDLWENHLDPA